MQTREKRLQLIGAAIARCRNNEDLTQQTLSQMLGYADHTYLSRIENGKAMPSMNALFGIADALQVNVKYFFSDL